MITRENPNKEKGTVLHKPDLFVTIETWFTKRSTPCIDNYVLHHNGYHSCVEIYS